VATKAPLAEEALRRIAALYEIETEIRGRTAEQRRAVRRALSRPLVAAMHTWLTETLGRISGRSALAQAIRYALNHWTGLVLFLDDGRLEMDTNTVERAMRPVAMRRSFCPSSSSNWKHWKFSLRIGATRGGLSPNGGGDTFPSQIGHLDLERRAGHDLFGGENLALDQAPDDVRSDAQFLGGFPHRQPLAILLGGTVGVDVVDPSEVTDPLRIPRFSLARSQTHPVQM